jgi:hypothetical protein
LAVAKGRRRIWDGQRERGDSLPEGSSGHHGFANRLRLPQVLVEGSKLAASCLVPLPINLGEPLLGDLLSRVLSDDFRIDGDLLAVDPGDRCSNSSPWRRSHHSTNGERVFPRRGTHFDRVCPVNGTFLCQPSWDREVTVSRIMVR